MRFSCIFTKTRRTIVILSYGFRDRLRTAKIIIQQSHKIKTVDGDSGVRVSVT